MINNIERAHLEFKQFVEADKITHQTKPKYLKLYEQDAYYFMRKAFENYALGEETHGDHCATLAERLFVKAQLLKNYSTEKSVTRRSINSKIAAFKG